MTVRELQKLLRLYPAEAEVFVVDMQCDHSEPVNGVLDRTDDAPAFDRVVLLIDGRVDASS